MISAAPTQATHPDRVVDNNARQHMSPDPTGIVARFRLGTFIWQLVAHLLSFPFSPIAVAQKPLLSLSRPLHTVSAYGTGATVKVMNRVLRYSMPVTTVH